MASVLITDMIDSCPGNPSIAVTNDWIVRVMSFASDHFALDFIHDRSDASRSVPVSHGTRTKMSVITTRCEDEDGKD
ncbi:hypothetical protein ACRU44_00910 [Mycobacterium colombiense]